MSEEKNIDWTVSDLIYTLLNKARCTTKEGTYEWNGDNFVLLKKL